MYYNEIRIGALLHDIGKLYQKAGKGAVVGGIEIKGAHPIISEKFIQYFKDKFEAVGLNVDAIKEVVRRHHEADIKDANPKYKHLCKLVSRADTISSYERSIKENEESEWSRSKQYNNYETVPLTSLFSMLSTGKKVNIPVGLYNSAIIRASSRHVLNTTAKNKEFIEKFHLAFSNIAETDVNILFNKIEMVLKRFTWCFPSDSQRALPDVSLYDHLKTTAAITSIMYIELTSDEKYSKGLRSTCKVAGQEFVGERVNDTECLALFKIGARDADKFMMSNRNVKNSAVESIASNQSLIKNKLQDLVSELLGCGNGSRGGSRIGNTNTLNSSDSEYTLLLNRNNKQQIFELVRKHSIELSKLTQLKTYFDVAYIELNQKDLYAQNTHEILKKLKETYDSRVECANYLGLPGILTNKSGNWATSTELFSKEMVINVPKEGSLEEDADKKYGTTKVFIKETSEKTMALVKIGITNVESLMSELFKIDGNTLNKITRDYERGQLILEGLGLKSNKGGNKDTEDETYEYGSISRVSSAMFNIQKAVKCTIKESENVMYITRSDSEIVLMTTLDRIFSVINSHKEFINKITLGTAKIAVAMQTFKHTDDIENKYKRVMDDYRSISSGSSELNIYNSISFSDEEFNQLNTVITLVRKSLALDKSIVYTLLEYSCMYRDYTDHGNVSALICVPRFFCKKVKHFNEGTITAELEEFVTAEFTKVINGEQGSRIFYSLNNIIRDAISLEIRG